MEKQDIIKLIEKHKYIMIGEIHGTSEIPIETIELVKDISKKNKIVFCLELPKQIEKELNDYILGKISKKALLSSEYLQDAIYDKRITDNNLKMYFVLSKMGIMIKCLEDYEMENPNERDKFMAKRFIEINKEIKSDKYLIYVGNMHVIKKSIKVLDFIVNPIPIYLPKEIIESTLIIQFGKSNNKTIEYDEDNNIINYNLIINEISANKMNINNGFEK